jgi:uncharacterized protein YecT (DUF1311 family)
MGFVGALHSLRSFRRRLPWALGLSSMRTKLALLAALAFASNAYAKDLDRSAQRMANCGHGNQREQNECIAAESVRLNNRLNDLFRQLIASLEKPTDLKNAQESWVKYRDLTCKYETSGISKGGSILPFAQNVCLADATENRIEDIERYLKQNCNGCPPRKSGVLK